MLLENHAGLASEPVQIFAIPVSGESGNAKLAAVETAHEIETSQKSGFTGT